MLTRRQVKYNHSLFVLAAPVADEKQKEAIVINVLFHNEMMLLREELKWKTTPSSFFARTHSEILFLHMKSYFQAVKYACVSTQQPLKRLKLSTQYAFIILTEIPRQPSPRQCYKSEWSTKGNERSWGQSQLCSWLHTNWPNLSSQKTEEDLSKVAPRTISPWLPLSPWAPWWRQNRQTIAPSLPDSRMCITLGTREDRRYIQDDRWGRWCRWVPTFLLHPGERRLIRLYDGTSDEVLIIFHHQHTKILLCLWFSTHHQSTRSFWSLNTRWACVAWRPLNTHRRYLFY